MSDQGQSGSGVSRYRVEEFPGGFRVVGAERNPVRVILEQAALRVEYEGRDEEDTRKPVVGWLCLFQYHRLCRQVAEGLMAFWESPSGKGGWFGARDWAIKRVEKAVAGHMHPHWQALLEQADPTVRAVHRAIFAATFGGSDLATEPDLYRNPWLVRDICRYRAAAVAVAHADELVGAAIERRSEGPLPRIAVDVSAADAGNWNYPPNLGDPELCLPALEDWRALFSPTGKAYRSLDRTLMNLPGGVPSGLLCRLADVVLPRPITSRLELLFVLLWADVRRVALPPPQNNAVVLYARADQIAEAMRRLSAHTRNNFSPRRARDVEDLARFLADYPEPHRGNVVGWTDRVIAWHRTSRERLIARTVDSLGADTATALPPIPLPNLPGVRFLDTVGAVAREGARMEHCIASCARSAVSGLCYLFHVEHAGEPASIQVSPGGRVVQAYGPRNRKNRASRWGSGVLTRWGRALPPDPPSPVRDDDYDPFEGGVVEVRDGMPLLLNYF